MIGATRQSLKFRNSSVTVGFDPLSSIKPGASVPRETILYETIEGEVVPYTIVHNEHNPADLAPTYVAQTEGYVEVWPGASLVKCKKPALHSLRVGADRQKRGMRGKITSFSRQSRWRMQQQIAKMPLTQIPLFVTLTYPGEFSLEPEHWKRDLDKFFKRLRRRFPLSSALWKLEAQKRNAPHYHMFIWGVDEILLRKWIHRAWYEVVDSGDKHHCREGVKVQRVRSWRGVRSYVAKYMGKEQTKRPGWEFPGRYWGIFNARKLPAVKSVVFILRRAESILIMRNMRKYAQLDKRKGKRPKGRYFARDLPSLTILCNNADAWLNMVKDHYRHEVKP